MTRFAALLAATLASTGALATETFDVYRGGQTTRVTARLVTEGLGYSTVRHVKEAKGACHRVQVTCREGTFAQACCPTMEHKAACPTAKIACR